MAVKICLLTQLPSDAWFEGMVARPSGDLLLARVDQPRLYSLSTADPEAQPEVLHTFPEDMCTGVINICELAGCPDEYILLTGRMDLAQVQADNFVLWRVALDGSGARAPAITKVAELPQAGLALDVATASPRTVLVCDSRTSSIYAVDVATGTSAVFLTDPLFAPAGADDFFGINTIRVVGEHLWFTNSSRGLVGRVPVRRRNYDGDDAGLAVAGAVEVLAHDVPDCDGFSVAADGRAAYTASPSEGKLWEVALDADGRAGATTTVLADQLVHPTAVQLVPAAAGPPRLYAVCCGQIEVGWLDADRDPWEDIAVGLKGLTTTVEVTEVVETRGA